jgi:hypothetical protein
MSQLLNPFLRLMPADALRTPMSDVASHLAKHFGEDFFAALMPEHRIPSPAATHKDCAWMRTANTVGINVRTIGSFWNIIPYCLTLPKAQNTIHILPIWEPGVVASLYGPASWKINPEFYSSELAYNFPHLDSVEKQLKVVVNLLHLLGKNVGMDVVPHTDRYSEMVLANPEHFEWLQRQDLKIIRHNSDLWRAVRSLIFEYLTNFGPAITGWNSPRSEVELFEALPEELRLALLFGEKHDYAGRLRRRKELIEVLYQMGYETVPATMGPPYRGIEVDPGPSARVIDEEGRVWLDYRITKPEKFSRVFGPLARYKLYFSQTDNANWELDFSKPCVETWDYVKAQYHKVQSEFDFDFMRGDMSHVQMRPEGVPTHPDEYYDLLGAVKQHIGVGKPYFAYFAESFLAPPGEMAYGDESEHLAASHADSTLGDLQSEPIHTPRFVEELARYRQILDQGQFAPNFTVMTADKDDPRFDSYYLHGNEVRYFMAMFLTDMPSYMGLGFECRDAHPYPAPNEHYTKLYVFQTQEGPKSTKGPYQWGSNRRLYHNILQIKELADEILPQIEGAPIKWLSGPSPDNLGKALVWTQSLQSKFIFAVNLGRDNEVELPIFSEEPGVWELVFHLNEGTGDGKLRPGGAAVWHKAPAPI